LDDEFIRYCELNNIEDIEKFAREVFNQGFTIIKYGNNPNNFTMKDYVEETKRMYPDKFPDVIKPVVPVSKETASIQVPNRYPEASVRVIKVDIDVVQNDNPPVFVDKGALKQLEKMISKEIKEEIKEIEKRKEKEQDLYDE